MPPCDRARLRYLRNPGNLLAPELTVQTGALIGYARVSTSGQLLDRQQHALAEASCLRVFAGKLSGKNCELAACLDYLRAALVRTVSFGPVIVGPIGAVIATARRHSQMRA
jgi:Resolvase, N terminal domain